MIDKLISSSRLIYIILAVLTVYACTDAKLGSTLVIHEIYKVEGDEASKKPTTLSYKDVKQYDEEGLLIQRNFYNVDNTLKGYEFIQKNGDKGVTNYYDVDSTLLAIYTLEYTGKLITKRTAFDGKTKEVLRSEIYRHDKDDNRIGKDIYNSNEQLVESFKMFFDTDGNEIELSRYNTSGQLSLKEKYQVSEKNAEGLWTERWGYVNGQPHSFHRRTFSTN